MSSEEPPKLEVPWTQANGIYANYDLHCHCGAVRLKMRLSPPLYKEQTEGKEQCIPVECNCSYCERNGYIGVHPLAKDVEITQGEEFIEKYYTAQKKNPMWFCRKCASVLITDLTNLMTEVFHSEVRYTVNVRMLKDFDPDRLQVRKVKMMKDMPPKYEI